MAKAVIRTTPLIVLLALSFLALPAHAATISKSSKPLTRTIDWAHPVRGYPGSGMKHSGLGSLATGDIVQSGGITPNANFPTACYNGVAYNVVVNGVDTWMLTNNGIEAWVQYQWCPRYSGDTVGINWAYGRDYPTSGCLTFEVGQTSSQPSYAGPHIYNFSGVSAFDGESLTQYNVCAPHYVWDYTLTVPGDGFYGVSMIAELNDHMTITTVTLQCCH